MAIISILCCHDIEVIARTKPAYRKLKLVAPSTFCQFGTNVDLRASCKRGFKVNRGASGLAREESKTSWSMERQLGKWSDISESKTTLFRGVGARSMPWAALWMCCEKPSCATWLTVMQTRSYHDTFSIPLGVSSVSLRSRTGNFSQNLLESLHDFLSVPIRLSWNSGFP